LGLLNHLHVWHDNSGKGSSSSWFLKYIIVRDLQTMEKSYFICQQWLSVEKGDGKVNFVKKRLIINLILIKIERVLSVSNDDQMREFVYTLSQKIYYNLSDDHLWYSIFSRPLGTKFTHVQRCICCFVLLFTMMLLNILYYDQTHETDNGTIINGFSLGPFYFTKQQVFL
jgi:polycystin 1L2